jgi:hypothetical protein
MPTKKRSTNHDEVQSTIQVLKEAIGPTSTGKSKLGYRLGSDNKGGIYFKITSNTGGGFFSNEWVAYSKIQAALDAWPEENPITSVVLQGLFRGRSANNSSFLLAALKAEGIVEVVRDRNRYHQRCDPRPFLAAVKQLKQGGSAAPKRKPKAKSKPGTKRTAKPASKKPASRAKRSK